MIKLMIWLCCFVLVACASRVTVDPKGCEGQGVWHRFDILEFDHDRYYDTFNKKDLLERFDFVIEKNIKTPFGIMKEERVYLKPLLEKNNIRCYEVQTLAITFHNTWQDVALSFLPLLGSKTLLIYGKFWEKRNIKEDGEPGQ